jgi:hypothetical protein
MHFLCLVVTVTLEIQEPTAHRQQGHLERADLHFHSIYLMDNQQPGTTVSAEAAVVAAAVCLREQTAYVTTLDLEQAGLVELAVAEVLRGLVDTVEVDPSVYT